ncbi:MAG: PGF-pre-PGF domain-containing protein [Nanoarchaeota archaeon]
MAIKKSSKSLLFIFAIIIITFFAFFVIAGVLVNTGNSVKVNAPATGNNFSSQNATGNLPTLFNVTFLNGTSTFSDTNGTGGAAGRLFNATFWVNISSAQWVAIGNSTRCLTHEASGMNNNMSCWALLNASALFNGTLLSDGYYTVNASIWNGTALIYTSTANSTVILIDNNVNVNTTVLTSGTNHSVKSSSGNLTLNVSIPDLVVSTIDNVRFNIVNLTGGVNSSVVASREGTGVYWSVNINTSHFSDGKYNITIEANDTLGNVNSSANGTSTTPLKSVIFDNTKPTGTFSCTPSPVVRGDTLICTCNPSDATSGVDTSSYTTNPSTANTGTYTTTCAITDKASNSVTLSAEYTVEGTGGGASSSSGGGSSGTTTGVEEQKSTKFVEINPESPATVKNFGTDYGLKEISISVNTKATDVKIIVSRFTSAPPTTTTKEGKVYKYLQITQEKLDGKLASATITIKVEKAWVNANGLSKENVVISKFVGNSWSELPTSYKEEDSNYYYYTTAVNSFSFFAISEKAKTAVVAAEAPRPTPVPQLAPSTSTASSVWFWLIIILVIVIAVVWWFAKKKKHY